jgi:signal peptidase II
VSQAAAVRAVAVVGLTTAVDQVTKAIAVGSLRPGESVNVFLGLDVTYVRNEGVAFGALVAYFALNSDVRFLWLPVGLILGGALGNLADRAREGAVIDFIDPIAWPAFNLADAAIVVGVLALIYVAEASR